MLLLLMLLLLLLCVVMLLLKMLLLLLLCCVLALDIGRRHGSSAGSKDTGTVCIELINLFILMFEKEDDKRVFIGFHLPRIRFVFARTCVSSKVIKFFS